MMPTVFFIVFVFYIGQILSNSLEYENCFMHNSLKRLHVLPGLGWDNLDNTEKDRIFDLKYTKCQSSVDNKFELPDSVNLIPKRFSLVETQTEMFSHYLNFTSTLSKSMKLNSSEITHGFSLAGQFSDETAQVKRFQLKYRSHILQSELRYNRYKSTFDADAPLSSKFKDRIINIAKWITKMDSYNHGDFLYTSYLADMIIRDFGTHVIRSEDIGAVLSKIDILKEDYQNNSGPIAGSAIPSILSLVQLGSEYKATIPSNMIDDYHKSIGTTIITHHGGTEFVPEMRLNKWTETINDNLVAIDRSGEPIYYALSQTALPMLSDSTIHKISNLLKDAVNRYYNANTQRGCVNFLSPNFNLDANIDEENCNSPSIDFSFGGLYKVCVGSHDMCEKVQQPNPLTGSYSCPAGFLSVMLHSGLNECLEVCERWIIRKYCHTECSHFQIFWCYPLKSGLNSKGYQFGGFINPKMPVCSPRYSYMKFIGSIGLCVSKNAFLKDHYAMPFGGFFSCSVGNPLAQSFLKDNKHTNYLSRNSENWKKGCPDGYVAHVITVDQYCQISFCTATNKFSQSSAPALKRPPFINANVNLNSSSPICLRLNKGELLLLECEEEETEIIPEHNPHLESQINGFVIDDKTRCLYLKGGKLFLYDCKMDVKINTIKYKSSWKLSTSRLVEIAIILVTIFNTCINT